VLSPSLSAAAKISSSPPKECKKGYLPPLFPPLFFFFPYMHKRHDDDPPPPFPTMFPSIWASSWQILCASAPSARANYGVPCQGLPLSSFLSDGIRRGSAIPFTQACQAPIHRSLPLSVTTHLILIKKEGPLPFPSFRLER